VERPDATLAVVCGMVVKAHLGSEAYWTEYIRILDKGQVPARDILKTVFGVDFVYENVR
jgi:acetyl-CoA carboxylase / biotin carboxylase 1